jgi:hypothetical protein
VNIPGDKVWSVVGFMHSHPSTTAKRIADRMAKAMWAAADAKAVLDREVKLAASWSSANFRDATAKHPHIYTYRAISDLDDSLNPRG